MGINQGSSAVEMLNIAYLACRRNFAMRCYR